MNLIKAIVVAFAMAGCAAQKPPVDPKVTDEIGQLLVLRDARKITWTQWIERSAPLIAQANDNPRRAEFIAYARVIAERVDGKKMTPAEGQFEIARIGGLLDREAQAATEAANQRARARFGAALIGASRSMDDMIKQNEARRPVTTTCERRFGQVVCETR